MANKVYQIPETALDWKDTSAPRTFSLNNLAFGTGQQGDLHDLGVAARSPWYAWRGWFQAATTPVVGEAVRVYIKTSDGTIPDNDDGTTDALVSAEDKLKNLTQIGTIIVDEAALGVKFVKSGVLWLPHRHVTPVFWNATADNLVATDDLSGFSLTPIPRQIQ